MDDRPVALRSGGMMKQEDGDRLGQQWSDLDKSIKTEKCMRLNRVMDHHHSRLQ